MTQSLTLTQIQADPLAVIRTHMEREPLLWWGGMFHHSTGRLYARDRGITVEELLAEYRRETLEAEAVAQLIAAARFIDQAPRIQGLNRKRSTYGWKHAAERWHRRQGKEAYVGEGMFIIASRAMGVTVYRNSLGRHFVNLSSRAVPRHRLEDWA